MVVSFCMAGSIGNALRKASEKCGNAALDNVGTVAQIGGKQTEDAMNIEAIIQDLTDTKARRMALENMLATAGHYTRVRLEDKLWDIRARESWLCRKYDEMAG